MDWYLVSSQLYFTINLEEIFYFNNKKYRIYAVFGVSQTPIASILWKGGGADGAGLRKGKAVFIVYGRIDRYGFYGSTIGGDGDHAGSISNRKCDGR
ncbi:MAG: hypothetical protein ACLVJ3_16335 [Coprococcus phoceensis]